MAIHTVRVIPLYPPASSSFCLLSDLFELPDHITHCQHIIEFFRPRQSDFKDHKLPLYKMTSLSGLLFLSVHCIVSTEFVLQN